MDKTKGGNHRVIPLYTSSGQTGGFLVYPYIYNNTGDWIGWVTDDQKVYTVHGRYVGWMNRDGRILRRRSDDYQQPSMPPPPAPPPLIPPATVPLPPMMSELKYETIDVLDEMPEIMPTLDEFACQDE